jgi:hypothetical protein
MELKHTVELMNSECYKDRFVAEYLQTKIRYEKLKAFNNKLEAAERTQYTDKKVEMPVHDCPLDLLREQQSIMGQYLHLLEVRAVIEGINLDNRPIFETIRSTMRKHYDDLICAKKAELLKMQEDC